MLDVTEYDIARRCGHGPTEAGRRYHRQARVVEFSREGDTVRSAVKGSERVPYRQTITLSERRGGVEIAGRCNCPMRNNCKHVAAALFHAMTVSSGGQGRGGKGSGTAARSPARHRRSPSPDASPARLLIPIFPSGVLAWLEDLARASEASGEDYPSRR